MPSYCPEICAASRAASGIRLDVNVQLLLLGTCPDRRLSARISNVWPGSIRSESQLAIRREAVCVSVCVPPAQRGSGAAVPEGGAEG